MHPMKPRLCSGNSPRWTTQTRTPNWWPFEVGRSLGSASKGRPRRSLSTMPCHPRRGRNAIIFVALTWAPHVDAATHELLMAVNGLVASAPYPAVRFLWSSRVTSMRAPLYIVQLPSWCHRARGICRRRRRRHCVTHSRHKWHYCNLPGWCIWELALIHAGTPIWTPPHMHNTQPQPCAARQHHTPACPRLPRLLLWYLARRLICLATDVQPSLRQPDPPHQPHMSFLALNVGGPFLSLLRL